MIDFQCSQCLKVLRVADEHAGAKASCPNCGTLMEIPVSSTVGIPFNVSAPANDGRTHNESPSGDGNADASSGVKRCPFCAETIKAHAIKCRFCGARLDDDLDDSEPGKFDFGRVFSDSIEIFKEQLGLCLGATIVAYLLPMVCLIPLSIVFFLTLAGAAHAGEPTGLEFVLVGGTMACYFATFLTFAVMHSSLSRWCDRLVTGERVTIGDVFPQMYMIPRIIGFSLVYGLMQMIGSILCVIPGFVVLILFWPANYLIHEPECDVWGALERAKKITTRDWVNSLVVVLVAALIAQAGALILYIGMLFTVPFANILMAKSYRTLRLSYERTSGTL